MIKFCHCNELKDTWKSMDVFNVQTNPQIYGDDFQIPEDFDYCEKCSYVFFYDPWHENFMMDLRSMNEV